MSRIQLLDWPSREDASAMNDLDLLCEALFLLTRDDIPKTEKSRKFEYSSHCLTAAIQNVLLLRNVLKKITFESPTRLNYSFRITNPITPHLLMRSIYDTFLHWYYYCVEEVSGEEEEFRWLLIEYFEKRDRCELMEIIKSPRKQIPELNAERNNLKGIIENHNQYKLLGRKKKDKIWEKHSNSPETSKQLAARSGIDLQYHNGVHKYASCYVHIGPYAISQLRQYCSKTADNKTFLNTKTREAVVLLSLYLDSATKLYPTFSLADNISETVETWVNYAANASKLQLESVKE